MSKTFTLHVPISKVDEDQRMVYGVATTEDVDSQGDIVDYAASKKAFSEWLGNIREMHEPRAVGKAIDIQYDDEAKQVIIGAKISESADGENAWIKVQEGILTGFSIGGKVHKISTEKIKNDNGDEVSATRIVDYDLSETSLVDNPANKNAKFLMVKNTKGGLQRVEEEIEVSHETTKGQVLRLPAWHGQFMLPIEKAQALYDKNSMNKKDYSDKQRQGMADSGEAMPDGSFPIKTKADLKNAIQSYGRSKQKDAVKQHIISRAKALGATDLLPEEWNVKSKASITEDLKKSVCDASWLANLAAGLVAYIKSEAQEGDAADAGQITELKSALGVIQEAIAAEVTEGDDFEPSDNLYETVMYAQQAVDLKKSVIGEEKRDENAQPVENQPAKNVGEPVAVTVPAPAEEPAKEEPKVEEPAPVPEKPAEAPAAPAEPAKPVETPAPEAPVAPEAPAEPVVEEPKAAEPKADAPAEEPALPEEPVDDAGKAVTVGDLRKFTDGFIAKLGDSNKQEITKTLGEFTDKVEKTVSSLEDRIKKLEDQPVASRVKASYVDVSKGDENQTVEEGEVAAMLKRRDELAANPQLGTPQERMELANKLRKAQAAGHNIS